MRALFYLLFILFIATLLIPNTYAQKAFPFKNKNNKWGLINRNGHIIYEPTCEIIRNFNEASYALIKEGGKYGILSEKGKYLFEPKYDKIIILDSIYLSIYNKEKCKLSTISKTILSNNFYDQIVPFSRDLFKTYEEGKEGLISSNGKEVLPAIYDKIHPFKKKDKISSFTKGQKFGVFNIHGAVLLPCNFDSISFSTVYIKGRKNNFISYGEIDSSGKLLFIKDFPNETALSIYLNNKKTNERLSPIKSGKLSETFYWDLEGFDFKLKNPVGKLAYPKSFYNVSIDTATHLSLAKKVEDKSEWSYIFDMLNGKLAYKAPLKDIFLTDYQSVSIARATRDTLWDALVNKEGRIINKVNSKSITNIGGFSEGLAWVNCNKKYGYINTKAELTIPLEYDLADSFVNGYATVRKGKKFGVINTKGEVIIPITYDGIKPFQVSLFFVKKGAGDTGKWGAVDQNNKEVIPFEYSELDFCSQAIIKARKNDLFGLLNHKGEIVAPFTIKCDAIGDFKNGIAKISKDKVEEKTGLGIVSRYLSHGYITEKGKLLIPPIYQNLGSFETIWKRQSGITQIKKNDRIGYIDFRGNVIVEPKYQGVENFEAVWESNKGLASVKADGKVGFINHNGNEVLPLDYDYVSEHFPKAYSDSSGVTIAKKAGKWGLINYEGSVKVPFLYDKIKHLNGNIVAAEKNKKWGLISSDNKVILDFEYDGIRASENAKNHFLEVYKAKPIYYKIDSLGFFQTISKQEFDALKNNLSQKSKYQVKSVKGKKGLVDQNGSWLIKPKYKNIGLPKEGLIWFQADAKKAIDQKYGFLDLSGNEVIPSIYSKVMDFSNGIAAVQYRGKWGYINSKGEWEIQPSYKSAKGFSVNYAIVNNDEVIDKQGKLVGNIPKGITPESSFINKRAKAKSSNGEFHIKPSGKPAYYEKYDEVTDFNGKVAFAKKGELWNLIRESNGKKYNIPFNKGNKLEYIDQYGYGRVVKTKFGDYRKDLNWELIRDGIWRLIDVDGNIICKTFFEEVLPSSDGSFIAKTSKKFGLVDLNGKILIPTEYSYMESVSSDVIFCEKNGKTYYWDVEKQKWLSQ